MQPRRDGGTIEFEAFGALLPSDRRFQTLSVGRQKTVREIVQSLGIDPDEIGLVTINGIQSDLGDTVPPQSRLCVFPPMSGG